MAGLSACGSSGDVSATTEAAVASFETVLPSVATTLAASTTVVLTTVAPEPSVAASTTLPALGCRAGELAGSLGVPGVGAGNFYQPLVVLNIGPRTCTLNGFPDVSLRDRSGEQIGTPAERAEGTRTTVSLTPGSTASALLHMTNGPIGGPCVEASVSLKLYLPDEPDALVFPAIFTACGGFSVRPFVAGASGL